MMETIERMINNYVLKLFNYVLKYQYDVYVRMLIKILLDNARNSI